MAKKWSDLCTFFSKMILVFNFSVRKYCLLFFAAFELFTLHNNITCMTILEKNEQAKLVENLSPSYLPYRFLHNLVAKTNGFLSKHAKRLQISSV